MLPRRKLVSSHTGADAALLRPPNLRAVGALPFTRQDRETLATWLAESGWPRGGMDIATLEGYLIALLVWPVGLPPGAWLPPIWGERSGWRVPAKIASPEAYTRFTGLVIGFLQELDRQLSACPPCFAPTLSKRDPVHGRSPPPGISWAQGFLQALQQNSLGLRWRSTSARSAVARIAYFASFSAAPTGASAKTAAHLKAAVLTLLSERVTRVARGPLGGLESRRPTPVGLTDAASTLSSTSPPQYKRHD